MSAKLMERLIGENAGPPLDITGAGLDSDWLNMGVGTKALVLFMTGAWAGGTSAVTLEQATAAAGTGAKALAIVKGWKKTTAGWVAFAITSNTFDLDTANALYALEVSAAELDTNGGFAYLQAKAATPGTNADLLAIAIILDTHYMGDPATLQDPKA